MNLERSTYTPVSNGNSSVRPRNRRLISYGDEDDRNLEAAGTSTPRAPPRQTSAFPPREISPIPLPHPSRPLSTTANAGSVLGTGYDKRRSDRHQSNASSGFGLWESWSSLQGIASTLLGGDDDEQVKKDKRNGAFNGSISGKPTKSSGPWYPRPQWGPGTGPALKDMPGSREERQAIVQAKRREALLLADVNGCTDSGALYKRRDSDQRLSNPAISAEQNDDALVYVHRVKPQDTLAGVMIRYQCQPAVFRKVNGLWPNDNIQIRQHVFLPVEACAVRGRKIDAEVGLKEERRICSVLEVSDSKPSSYDASHTAITPPFPCINPTSNLNPEYKHEFFVSIPGIPEDVEIARISRRTLGFFPPSRRKSQTFSDNDISSSSPRTSVDLNSRLQSLSLNASPCRRDRPKKPRRSGSGFDFVDRLKGPGGVGTLRGSGPAGVVQPGPSEDSLNKMFAHRLPNVAPRQSFDSVHSTSSSTTGLENVGGVIEGWVRKMGTRLAGSLESTDAYRQQSRLGDLIELESSGDGVDGEQDDILVVGGGGGGPLAQKRERASAAVDDAPESSSSAGRTNSRDLFRGKGTAGVVTATEEALLRERFPPRGRVVDSQKNKRR